MLEKFKEFEIENQLAVLGGTNNAHNPACFVKPD